MYTVLVADDEELERKVVAFTLQNSGLPIEIVTEASNGREALEQAAQTGPDIILMDIKMPGIDGLEATRHIKALFPVTEIIILTAYGKFSYSQQAIKAQADDYLLKPIQPQQLNKAVAEAIARLEAKRLRPGPAVDLLKVTDPLRLGNLERAKREWTDLLKAVERENSEVPNEGNGLRAANGPAGHDQAGYGMAWVGRSAGYDLGWRLLVIAGQLALAAGTANTEVTALEESVAPELARIVSWAGLQEWGERLLEKCLTLIAQEGSTPDHMIVTQAAEYIETHFGEDLSLVKLSAHVHLSPTYLSRIFKKKMGMGFSEYVMQVRLKAARYRLRNSSDSIEQIAEVLGFSSSSYFSSAFRKAEGATPSEYRTKRHL